MSSKILFTIIIKIYRRIRKWLPKWRGQPGSCVRISSDSRHPTTLDTVQLEELRELTELKRNFLRKEMNRSLQVANILADVKEQKSLNRTCEITKKRSSSEKLHRSNLESIS
ncbi:hypothetical protein YC2023_017285 [Brassica napus]